MSPLLQGQGVITYRKWLMVLKRRKEKGRRERNKNGWDDQGALQDPASFSTGISACRATVLSKGGWA